MRSALVQRVTAELRARSLRCNPPADIRNNQTVGDSHPRCESIECLAEADLRSPSSWQSRPRSLACRRSWPSASHSSTSPRPGDVWSRSERGRPLVPCAQTHRSLPMPLRASDRQPPIVGPVSRRALPRRFLSRECGAFRRWARSSTAFSRAPPRDPTRRQHAAEERRHQGQSFRREEKSTQGQVQSVPAGIATTHRYRGRGLLRSTEGPPDRRHEPGHSMREIR